ncbi:MAG TPA: hypothetical protein DCR95_13730 [Desulfobacter sp.]|nr:hypothetical protein [Desulfobacter sp.]
MWRTFKHHYIYLHSFGAESELRKGLRSWFDFYHRERFHQSLDNQIPDEVCFGFPHPAKKAA